MDTPLQAPPITVRRGRVATKARRPGGAGGSGDAVAALHRKDYGRCAAGLGPRQAAGSLRAGDQRVLGWCLMGLERPTEAARVFHAAGASGDAAGRRDAAYGEAMALLRSGDTAGAADVVGTAGIAGEKRRSLTADILDSEADAAFKAERWDEALAKLDRRRALGEETRDRLVRRGWALYHLGDYAAARAIFARIDAVLSDADSRRALAVVDDAMGPRAR